MSNAVVIHKGRTKTILLRLGEDVSPPQGQTIDDVIKSEIRAAPDIGALLIATWVPSYVSDGTDGEVLLTLDNTITSQITQLEGYMDIKRTKDGEPIPVFDAPLPVEFRGSVTE